MADPAAVNLEALVQAIQQASQLLSNAASSATGGSAPISPTITVPALSKDRLEMLKKEVEYLQKNDEYYKSIGESIEAINKVNSTRLQILDSLITKAKQENEDEKIEKLNNYRRALQAVDDLQRKTPKTVGELVEQTLLLKKAQESATQQFQNLGDAIENNLMSNLKSTINAFDSWNVSINKAFVGQERFIQSTKVLAEANLDLGISYEETRQAQVELSRGYAGFMVLSDDVSKKYSEQISKLQALSIATGAFIKNLNLLQIAYKKTAEEATRINDNLIGLSNTLGITADQVAQDLQAASATVGSYGERMMEVFYRLENISVKTGISMGNLLSIAKKFDTFQGAAESAGKLNAILGGALLNSSELLAATEEERLKLIYEAVNASGQEFTSLGKYEQMSIAAAAGISDLNEARRLFMMDGNEFTKQIATNNIEQKQYNDLIEKSKTANEKWQMALMQLSIALEPIARGLSSFASFISKSEIAVYGFVIALAALKGYFMWQELAYKRAIVSLSAHTSALVTNTAAEGGSNATKAAGIAVEQQAAATEAERIAILEAKIVALESTAAAERTAGNAAKFSAGQMLAFGGAIALIGVGIGAAAYGLSFLVKSFKDLTTGQMVGGLTAMIFLLGGFALIIKFALIPAIITLGATSSVTALPLLALGASFALIGGGIFLAAFGMSKFVDSFAKLTPDQAFAAAEGLLALSVAMLAIALVGANPVALAGILIMFGVMAFAINSMKTEVLESISSLAQYSNELASVAVSIYDIANAINSLPEMSLGVLTTTRFVDKVIELSQSNPLDTVELFKETANITPTTVSNVREMTNEISRLNTEINVSSTTNNNFDQLVTAIKEETSTVMKALEKPITVDVSIDRSSVGRTVFSLIDEVTTKNVVPASPPAGAGR